MRTAREARRLAREFEEPKGLEDVLVLGRIALQGERRLLDQLGKLRSPRPDRTLIRQMLALYDAHHRWFRRALGALRREDLGGALRAGRRADELSQEAEGILAFQLRATKCSATEGQALGLVSTG